MRLELSPLKTRVVDSITKYITDLLEKNFMNYIATKAELKRNTFGMGISNSTQPFLAPVWKERKVIREIEVVYGRYCGTKNNARQTNCVKCNASIH